MEKNSFKYISTKLNNLYFDSEKFSERIDFTLNITNNLKTNEDTNSSVIKIVALLQAKSSEDENFTSIELEAMFKVDNLIDDEKLEEIVENNKEFLNKPILDEMTLIFGMITGKSFKAPLIFPFSSIAEDANEVKEN